MAKTNEVDTVGFLIVCLRCRHKWPVRIGDYSLDTSCPKCDKSKVFKGYTDLLCSVNEREFCIYELIDMGLARTALFD